MNKLWNFLGGLVEAILGFAVTKGFKNSALILSYITLYIGLFVAFIVTTGIAFWALEPLMPDIVPFVLSMFPPVAFTYFNLYFTALVARRVFDWHKRVSKDFTQALLF